MPVGRYEQHPRTNQRLVLAGADGQDPADAFGADVGWDLRGDEVLAADVEEVRGVDGGGLNLDEHLAGTRCGRLEFDELKNLGRFADCGDLQFIHDGPSICVGISPV